MARLIRLQLKEQKDYKEEKEMSDVYVNGQLIDSAEDYRTVATDLNSSIETMDETIQKMTTGAVFGECAPEGIIKLWTGGDQEGVRAAMESYVTKMNDVAVMVEAVVSDVQTVDAQAGEAAPTTVAVEQAPTG